MSNEAILIYNALSSEKFITRRALTKKVGMTDRLMRRYMQEIRREYGIINNQDGKGYKLPGNKEEAEKVLQQEEKRAKTIFYNIKGLKKYIKSK